MIAQIKINEKKAIQIDLNKPIDISIPIRNGSENPNCYWAEQVNFETIKADGFIGSVAEGGTVNYQKVSFTPHGNGTHVECYGHITNSRATVNQQLKTFHFYAKLITVTPIETSNGDHVIVLNNTIKGYDFTNVKALIIRTLPNNEDKLNRSYSGKNPPYVSPELIEFIVNKGIEHILIDLPSLDKEVDNGKLLSHKAFWQIPKSTRVDATITELIYVPNSIPDANYLLNLQTINLEMDAAPCRPTLFTINKIIPLTS